MQPIAILIGFKNMEINKYLSMEQLIEKAHLASAPRDTGKGEFTAFTLPEQTDNLMHGCLK